MAERSTWSGAISFGLVNVPVKLYTAVAEKNVKFNQLNPATGARIRMKRVDEGTGEEVAYNDIIKGFEVSPGNYVTVTAEELDSVAPAKTKILTIEQFVLAEQIDSLWYDAHYYVGPDGEAALKAYGLLAEAMAASGQVAIGSFVMRSKEKLAALRATEDGVIVCSTLIMADEVKPAERCIDIEAIPLPLEAEREQAKLLIGALSGDFDHDAYRDAYRDQVMALIQAKSEGKTIEAPATDGEAKPAPDLMAALSASLEQAKTKAPAKKSTPTKKKAAAK
jgi:DNA end-binding protein Ku